MIMVMEIVADKLSSGSEGRIRQRVDGIGKHKDSGAEWVWEETPRKEAEGAILIDQSVTGML